MIRHFNRYIVGTIIFAIVLIVLGVGYPLIGFDSDSLGLVHHFLHITDIWSLLTSMTERLELTFLCTNQSMEPIHFFSFYRPLAHPIFFLLVTFFKTYAWPYFFLSIVWHAAISALLFYIYSLFLPQWVSALLALGFAFHPAHAEFFLGTTCFAIPYYFFFVVAVIFYIWWLETEKNYWLVLTILFYLASLFIYEMPIIFPAVALWYFLFFDRKNSFKKTWALFAATLGYFIVRYIFTGGLNETGVVGFPGSSIIRAIATWRFLMKPFWGLGSDQTLLVGIILLLWILLFVLFFIFQKERRKIMLFYLGAFFISSWVVTLGGGEARYLYLALPFFMLMTYELLLFVFQGMSVQHKKWAVGSVLVLFCLYSAKYSRSRIRLIEKYTHERDVGFDALANDYGHLPTMKLIFVGNLSKIDDMFYPLRSSMARGVWLFFNRSDIPVYDSGCYVDYKKEPKNNIVIEPVDRGYRFISPDGEPCGVSSSDLPGTSKKSLMGTAFVIQQECPWRASNFLYTFDDQWLTEEFLADAIFLRWDVKKKRYVELPKEHLKRAE